MNLELAELRKNRLATLAKLLVARTERMNSLTSTHSDKLAHVKAQETA